MTPSSPKNPTGWLFTTIVLLVVLTAFAPTLIALGHALLPLVIVSAIAIAVLRLIFFHTRNF